MRIVSGTHRGRSIHPPKNLTARPTTDFAKESLFNILNNYVEFSDMKVLDLFAGTGNISYEFASRGCKSVQAVDSDYNAVKFITSTAEGLKLPAIRATKADVFSFLKNATGKYNIIFADPPYDLEKVKELAPLIFEKDLLSDDGWLIIEHGPRTDLSDHPLFREKRVYGNVNFSFFYKPATE